MPPLSRTPAPRRGTAVVVQVPDFPADDVQQNHGVPVRKVMSKEALANPHALDYYRGLDELKR